MNAEEADWGWAWLLEKKKERLEGGPKTKKEKQGLELDAWRLETGSCCLLNPGCVGAGTKARGGLNRSREERRWLPDRGATTGAGRR